MGDMSRKILHQMQIDPDITIARAGRGRWSVAPAMLAPPQAH